MTCERGLLSFVVYQISLLEGSCPSGKSPFTTVAVQLALFPPAVAVMVAVPMPTPFTLPATTEATEASELVQVMAWSVALLGDTEAVRLTVSPMMRSTALWFSETDETATGVGGVGVGVGVGLGAGVGSSPQLATSIRKANVRNRVIVRIVVFLRSSTKITNYRQMSKKIPSRRLGAE